MAFSRCCMPVMSSVWFTPGVPSKASAKSPRRMQPASSQADPATAGGPRRGSARGWQPAAAGAA